MTTEQKFDCIFCQETFEDKETLQIHFRKHGDPKFGLSSKIVKNRTQNEAVLEKVGEDIEMVGCDVCEEVFPTISKAITHKHKAHPDHDAKYFCPFCGKLFTMKHLHNKHIQSNHISEEATDSKDFHCDMCEVTFNAPSAMMYHNKFFHRQDTEIPAIGHSKKVKLFSQEMLQIYYCAFCGEEFNNKVNLHNHIGDDHSDENQSPTEVLRCPLCEAIFYHLDAYELHLTFHSSEDLYSEKNELVEQITEFSLETVAPIMENVLEEDLATQPDEDNNMTNSEEINNFLQLVMGDQGDNVTMEKVKHKKHKKHKKSKKASITLDEFLNMNKDVFGDGLGDVQGIEEVPTQVVLKKVKGKAQNRNEAKMVNADLAKLKKQGIIVKPKAKNNTAVTKKHTSKQQNSGTAIDVQKNQPNLVQNSSSDILSKLLNQGNSQIKIVKKSVLQNIVNNEDGTQSAMSNSINNLGESNSNLTKDNGHANVEVMETQSNPIVNRQFSAYSEATLPCDEIGNDNKNDDNKKPLRDADFNGKDIMKNKQLASDCSTTISGRDYAEASSCALDTAETNIPDGNFANSTKEKTHQETKRITLENHSNKVSSNDDEFSDNTHDDDNSDKESETNLANKTISALKHLSHLITVKPLANHNKDLIKSNTNEENNMNEDDIETRDEHSLSKKINSKQKVSISKALTFGGQITVRHPKQSPSSTSPVVQSDPESEEEFTDDLENVIKKLEKKNVNSNLSKNIIQMKELKVNLVPLPQSTCNQFLLKNFNPKGSNDFVSEQRTTKEEKDKNIDCPKETSNLDILKRLPNVTAKPVNVTKVTDQQTTAKSHQTYVSQVQGTPSIKFNKGIDEDLEVYNIDDSDEDIEDALNQDSKVKQSCNVTADALKNLSKNITVKSSEIKMHPNIMKNIKLETTQSGSYSETYTQIKQSKEIQKSINLQNKLKTLGNITVKSRNSSQNVYNKDQHKMFEDYDDEHGNGSGSDNENIGRVKITELNEDYMSDNDNDFNDIHPNAVVESPNVSNSENEDNHDDLNEDLPDFENHIKTNTVKKNEVAMPNKTIPCFDNLKNLNKALTIKSLNTKNTEQVTNLPSNTEVSEDTNNPNHEMALKPYRPNVSQNEQPLSKNINQASSSTNQTTFNQKVNTASNQVNTVKTVNTVKRFQSQTVIEEVTTTVTKTIRTVNSSTNEVMQATSQNTPKPINRPQKIVNKQPGRELQGTAVRHVSPTIGTKIRNAVPVLRTPNTPIVRPSNQLVPVRPMFNRPRCPAPSTSAVRKVAPPRCSPQKPAIGKLKISPHALNQTSKRPSDESFGQFSPFKRPKDSFVPELPDFSDDDSSVQYSTASQSRSDFSSVTKSMKGKGVVTATQIRSEVSTSSQQQMSKGVATATQMRSEVCMSSQQQLSRLSNVSGLKVVKTSSKQVAQVEEKCEISPGKRNTLEALEKLQKQGLLVKKPRFEEYNDQANSYSESDDEFGEK